MAKAVLARLVMAQEVTETNSTISQAEGAQVLRRVGYSPELIREIFDQIGDPIDLDRDASILARYGITRERLINLMGGSP